MRLFQPLDDLGMGGVSHKHVQPPGGLANYYRQNAPGPW
jgi:hypothetical protein